MCVCVCCCGGPIVDGEVTVYAGWLVGETDDRHSCKRDLVDFETAWGSADYSQHQVVLWRAVGILPTERSSGSGRGSRAIVWGRK